MNKKDNPLKVYAVVSQIGFLVITPLLIFIWGGSVLVNKFSLPSWVMILLVFAGIITMISGVGTYLKNLIKMYGGKDDKKTYKYLSDRLTMTITTMTAVTGSCKYEKEITETTSFKECMALLPYYIGALVLLGIVSVILMISGIGDYTLLTGAVAGTAVSALNFVLMAISAEKAITLTEKSAKLAMNGSYGARYIGTFIILGVLMFFKIINPVTAVLPLFVPKIAYTVTAFKEKSDF